MLPTATGARPRGRARCLCAAALLLGACSGDARPLPSTPEATVESALDAVGEGDFAHLWRCLPPGHRRDAEGLLADLAATGSDVVWERSFEVVGRLGELLDRQEDFIATALLESADEDDEVPFDGPEELRASLAALSDLLAWLAESEVARLDGLDRLDVDAFLRELGRAPFWRDPLWASATEELGAVAVERLGEEGDAVLLSLEPPDGDAETVRFVPVEGRWVPAELAEEWTERVEEARASLSPETAGEARAMAMQVLGTVGGALDAMLIATTQEEFEAAFQQGVLSVVGAVLGSGLSSWIERAQAEE